MAVKDLTKAELAARLEAAEEALREANRTDDHDIIGQAQQGVQDEFPPGTSVWFRKSDAVDEGPEWRGYVQVDVGSESYFRLVADGLPRVDDPTAAPAEDLNALKRADLDLLAADHDLDTTDGNKYPTKASVIEAIEAARAASED